MRIMDFEGTAYERGLAQGEPLTEQYNEMMHEFFTSEMWKENKPKVLPNSIIKIALGMLGSMYTKKALQKYMPLQAERVRGIGEGLKAGGSFIWGIQFMEIMFCEAGSSLAVPQAGCTQVHATPSATRNSVPLLGRNYDFPNMLRPYQIVRRDRPSEKGRLATITVAQVPLLGAHQGMNEAGLVICANNARLWKGDDLKYSGVPYQILIMEMLETCRTVKEASEFATSFPEIANAGFFGMMDETGDCCVVEFTASRSRIRRPNDKGVMAQTNHYHAMPEANLPDGTYWTVKGMEGLEYATSTKKRFEAADRLLNEVAGDIDVDALKKVLSDHSGNDGTGNDNTVCCHGETGGTLASIIMDIDNRRIFISDGHPCSNEYAEVSLETSGTPEQLQPAAG